MYEYLSAPGNKTVDNGHRVLVVEDDREIAGLLRLHLEDAGFLVDLAHDGAAGLRRAAERACSVVVLDLMLPGLEGLELCRRLRARPDYVPILMLTAKSSEADRVVGLELGADDYVTKPFSLPELVARVKALIRRADALAARPEGVGRIEIGGLVIDVGARRASVDGRAADLTAKEFDLLLQFARHPGRVYTRDQLLDQVWGAAHQAYPHTVNSHINRLRTKIERDPSRPRYVQTVWGVGYRFMDSRDASGR
jgi:DNA-binding response OmpR family regulator